MDSTKEIKSVGHKAKGWDERISHPDEEKHEVVTKKVTGKLNSCLGAVCKGALDKISNAPNISVKEVSV